MKRLAFCIAVVALGASLAQAVPLPPPLASSGNKPPEPPYAPITYEGSGKSVNDRCPVRGGRLSQRIRPVYVNRRPVGFC